MFDTKWQVSRLMDLIVNSLYSNKEVFLRELIRYILSPDLFYFVFFVIEFLCVCYPTAMLVTHWISCVI